MKVSFSKETITRLNKETKKAQTLNNLRLFKISKALLMIADGKSLNEISGFVHISTRQIFNWLMRFMAEGFSWLVGLHYKGRGRKSKLTKTQKKRLYDMVCDGPEKCGYDCGIWTSGMIADLVFREFSVIYSPRYLCDLLKKIGLSYQKTAFESDHLDEEKRRIWREETWPKILKEAREKGAVILFCDEVSFAQWGSLSRTWAPKGQQPKIKTTGKRKGMKIFGAIGFFDGDFHYMETPEKFKAETYIQFLEDVLSKYDCPVILIEDGARYHTAKAACAYKDKMKAEGKLYTYLLPSYSPDYNPIEKLWRNTKKDATHCRYFPTFDDLRMSVIRAFEKYMKDATHIIGVMKKLRKDAGLSSTS